jgi:hypothetical protein
VGSFWPALLACLPERDFSPGHLEGLARARRRLLLNPATWAATEPVDGTAANPGEIGYVPSCQGGVNRGYVITGTGAEAGTTIMAIVRELPGLRARQADVKRTLPVM